jgi:hypothetical protein
VRIFVTAIKGYNRIGPFYRWSTACIVTEASPGRAFAFTIGWPSNSSWRYELAEVDDGTLVTQTMTKMQPQMAPVVWIQRFVGVDDRAEHLHEGMAATLHGLADAVNRSPAAPQK